MKVDLQPREGITYNLIMNNNKNFAIFHYTLKLFWNFGLAFHLLPCPAICGSMSHTHKLPKVF